MHKRTNNHTHTHLGDRTQRGDLQIRHAQIETQRHRQRPTQTQTDTDKYRHIYKHSRIRSQDTYATKQAQDIFCVQQGYKIFLRHKTEKKCPSEAKSKVKSYYSKQTHILWRIRLQETKPSHVRSIIIRTKGCPDVIRKLPNRDVMLAPSKLQFV